MDGLEKFVKQNRLFLDTEEPNPLIWEGIEQQLDGGKPDNVVSIQRGGFRVKLYRIARVAAAVLVLLTIGGMLGLHFFGGQEQMAVRTISDLNPEYAEMESFYTQKINTQINELKTYQYDKSILEDIAELDAAFKELKEELGESEEVVEDEEIIHAMIENYQTKIDILERVLTRLKTEKAPQSKKNEIEL